MRTFKNLFTKLCDPGHLDSAIDATVRGKRRHCDIAWFLFRREEELERLRTELEEGRWRPEEVELLLIRDPSCASSPVPRSLTGLSTTRWCWSWNRSSFQVL